MGALGPGKSGPPTHAQTTLVAVALDPNLRRNLTKMSLRCAYLAVSTNASCFPSISQECDFPRRVAKQIGSRYSRSRIEELIESANFDEFEFVFNLYRVALRCCSAVVGSTISARHRCQRLRPEHGARLSRRSLNPRRQGRCELRLHSREVRLSSVLQLLGVYAAANLL